MKPHSWICLAMAFAAIANATATEQQVLAIFEERCASCHREDEEPVLSKTTDLAALRLDAKIITAGDSANSPLFKLLNLPEGDKKRMPKSKASKRLPPLNAEEKAIIAEWIDGPAQVAARNFVSEQQIMAAVVDDLHKLGDQASGARYLSLANFYNDRDARGNPLHSDESMAYLRTGVAKLVNSLSWRPKIVVPEAIDATGAVLRILLSDYGLSADLWKKLAGAYPYNVDRAISEAGEAKRILGVLPVMRADYFVFALSQPPFYHEALGMPGGQKHRGADVELESKLGITFDNAIQSSDAVRSGFQKSGVSQGNRLIERLPRTDGGYYWKSYDFDPTRQNERGADLFRTPLGPNNGHLTKNDDLKFLHDGGEIVFSLPNGLQAYMLIDGRGVRLDEAPLSVVTDSSRKDSRIINGISCMSCHRDGIFMTNVKDEVRAASAYLNLANDDKATIERLHDQSKLERFFQLDAGAFAKAVAQCGPAGGQEPVSFIYKRFNEPLSAASLAAEMADNSPDLLGRLLKSEQQAITAIAAKLKGGTPVPRLDFENVFPLFVAELSIGRSLPRDRVTFTEFGGSIDNRTTIIDESSAGVAVRLLDRKKRDQRVIDAEQPSEEDIQLAQATPGEVKVKVYPAGTKSGVKPSDLPRKIFRVAPDGSVPPPETINPAPGANAPTTAPADGEAKAPAAPGADPTAPPTAPPAPAVETKGVTTPPSPTTAPAPGERKVFKIVTPQPGEDDFNTPSGPKVTVKQAPLVPSPATPAASKPADAKEEKANEPSTAPTGIPGTSPSTPAGDPGNLERLRNQRMVPATEPVPAVKPPPAKEKAPEPPPPPPAPSTEESKPRDKAEESKAPPATEPKPTDKSKS